MNILKEQTLRLGYLLGDFRDLIHMQFQKALAIYREPCSLEAILREESDEKILSRARFALSRQRQQEISSGERASVEDAQ